VNKSGKEWERLKNAIPEYPAPQIYTLTEVCDFLHICRSTVYRMIRRGEIRTLHMGRHHRVSALELERLMAQSGIYVPRKG